MRARANEDNAREREGGPRLNSSILNSSQTSTRQTYRGLVAV